MKLFGDDTIVIAEVSFCTNLSSRIRISEADNLAKSVKFTYEKEEQTLLQVNESLIFDHLLL